MSAKVNLGEKDEVQLRSPTRDEILKKPSDEEVAKCAPCRIVIMVIFIIGLLAMLVAAIVIIAVSPKCVKKTKPEPTVWWKKKGAVSQLNVQSFKQLKDNVTYLGELGAKSIVLESLYDSSNFTDVNPKMGSMKDLEEAVAALNSKGIKLIMDFNPCYTSDNSAWFKDSKSSKTSGKRAWYIWKQNPNNNWENNANESAWTFDNTTKESYYQYYGADKPALNYQSMDVRNAVKDALSFWLGKGIKGFKLNGVPYLLVDQSFRNSTSSNSSQKGLPGVHDIVKEWQAIVSGKDGLLIGSVPSAEPASYFGKSDKEIEFNVVINDYFAKARSPQSADKINKTITDFISKVPKYGLPGWTSGGGAESLGSRFPTEGNLINMLLLTLPGMSLSSSGDEVLLKDGQTMPSNYSADPAYKVFQTVNKIVAVEPAFESINMDVLYANGKVLVYHRSAPIKDRYVVALNFGSSPKANISAQHKSVTVKKGIIKFDNLMKIADEEIMLEKFDLKPHQGLMVKVTE